MATYFCPNCWHELSEPVQVCPECGYDLSHEAERSYEEKLLTSLKHPIQENRMIAVQLLGQLKARRAIPAFRDMLAGEEDYYLLKEVLYALAEVDDPEGMKLLMQATNHRFRLVRQVAQQLVTTKK